MQLYTANFSFAVKPTIWHFVLTKLSRDGRILLENKDPGSAATQILRAAEKPDQFQLPGFVKGIIFNKLIFRIVFQH